MQRGLIITLILVAVLAGTAWWWYNLDRVESVATTTPFRYGFELRNTSNTVVRDARLSVFAPAELPGRQQLLKIDANAPYTEERDEFGNRTLHFDLDLLPPYGTKVLLITGEVGLQSPAAASLLVEPAEFLQSEPSVQIEDPRIVAQARQLGEQPGELAENLLAFVHSHINDTGYLVEDRGAVYALTQGKGDCTEFMSLFTALARANDVPTRNLAGFLINPDGARLNSQDYHNWSEFHDGRRWILVDAQNNYINERQAYYLTFRVLTALSQLSNTQRFFASDPRLQTKLI